METTRVLRLSAHAGLRANTLSGGLLTAGVVGRGRVPARDGHAAAHPERRRKPGDARSAAAAALARMARAARPAREEIADRSARDAAARERRRRAALA